MAALFCVKVMKKYDIIAWDFNGTVLDDVQIGIESINVLLSRRGLNTINTREEYKNSFRFPIIEWYKTLGFDFEKEDYEVVAHEWVAEYLKRESLATLCDGVKTMLEYFKTKEKKQIIISASEISMLNRQLSSLGVAPYFDEVIGKNDVFAGGKIETAKLWREKNTGTMLFIGDTDHDLETAQAIGADCVLVASGHQSYERLNALKAENNINYNVVNCLLDVIAL